MMNATQRLLYDTEVARSHRYGWTVIESTVVPASRNLLGAHRDVAVLLCDTGDDTNGRWHLALTAADEFAGSRGRVDNFADAPRPLPNPHRRPRATQEALF